MVAVPCFAKAKSSGKAKEAAASARAEIQSQIEDYQDQLRLIDEHELESDEFDHALFDRIRSTYGREIRRLEKLKSKS